MTLSGKLTEFATPGLGGLQWITAGRTRRCGSPPPTPVALGRISLTGVVPSYQLPSIFKVS